MLAAVQKAGVVHMICHNYRRAPAVMLARQLIEEGKLGRLYHYRGTYLQDWVADPSVPLYWRLQKDKAGSGALGDIASHSLDLARFLVGEITEVTAALETFVKERPLPDNPKKKGPVTVDDASASIVRFDNGALGTIEASRFATGRKNYNRFEINGSKGSVAFDMERMNELEVYLTDDDKSVQGFHTVMVTEPHHPFFKAWWPAGSHHRLRAHVHPYGVRPAAGGRRQQGALAELRRTACRTSACSRRWRSRRRRSGGRRCNDSGCRLVAAAFRQYLASGQTSPQPAACGLQSVALGDLPCVSAFLRFCSATSPSRKPLIT